MDHSFLVSFIKRCSDLNCQAHGFFFRQGTGEGLSLDIFKDKIIGTDIEELANIGMIQRRNGSRFLLESFAVLFLDFLDRYCAAEASVPRLPHFSIPPAPMGGFRRGRVWCRVRVSPHQSSIVKVHPKTRYQDGLSNFKDRAAMSFKREQKMAA
jgi:hypothetical protein